MRSQNLSKHVYLEYIRSAVQSIMTPQTSLTILICTVNLVLLTLRGKEQLQQPAIFVVPQQLDTLRHDAITGCENESDLTCKNFQVCKYERANYPLCNMHEPIGVRSPLDEKHT
jgi:hypothetical protein